MSIFNEFAKVFNVSNQTEGLMRLTPDQLHMIAKLYPNSQLSLLATRIAVIKEQYPYIKKGELKLLLKKPIIES